MGISPFKRFVDVILEERKDLVVLFIYTIFSGLFSLAIPLGAQVLVNTIAAASGMFFRQLVVICVLVFIGLLFAGALDILRLFLIETLQRRIFVRIAFRLARQMFRIRMSVLEEKYGPELVNRFFDTMTIQKTWATILVSWPASILQIIIGMVLIGIYSPYFLGFDLFLIIVIFAIVALGRGGVRTSIDESTEKYRVAHWLEELARCNTSFKMNGLYSFTIKHLDKKIVDYIYRRRAHFSIIVRQAFAGNMIQAVATTGIFAIGGWLVINQQLTIGQLVAAELVIVIILASLKRIIKQVDDFYDLLTGLHKIETVMELPRERDQGVISAGYRGGMEIVCRKIRFSYHTDHPIISDLNLEIYPGERVSLVGESGCGKTTLAYLFCGLYETERGLIDINKTDIQTLDLNRHRRNIALVSGPNQLFDGTIEENIILGREYIPKHDVDWALDFVELDRDLALLPRGLQTHIISEGLNISMGQRLRILIAREIVAKPQLLILDEAFNGTDEKTKLKILDNLLDKKLKWTVINITEDAEVVVKTDIVHVLKDGQIVESGSSEELAGSSSSMFSTLFPELIKQIRKKYVQGE
jgi:ABC-type bacteriocin/lantibiotic exporter with double-glycine peptidase domain